MGRVSAGIYSSDFNTTQQTWQDLCCMRTASFCTFPVTCMQGRGGWGKKGRGGGKAAADNAQGEPAQKRQRVDQRDFTGEDIHELLLQ
eukprot:1156471-Pelagomonas_calceolata.AAC.1